MWILLNKIYRFVSTWWSDLNIRFSAIVNLILIILNLIPLVVLVYFQLKYPHAQLTSVPELLALAAAGAIFNLYVCSKLGEEIDQEGFSAMLWAAFLTYLVFVVIVVWYVIYLNSEKHKYHLQRRTQMRLMLLPKNSDHI